MKSLIIVAAVLVGCSSDQSTSSENEESQVKQESSESSLSPLKVSCNYSYSKQTATGATGEFDPFTTFEVAIKAEEYAKDKKETEKRGFIMTASLDRVCAQDDGSCVDAADLRVEVKHKATNASSFMSLVISPQDRDRRFSTGITVGSERYSANCDVK